MLQINFCFKLTNKYPDENNKFSTAAYSFSSQAQSLFLLLKSDLTASASY